MFEKKSSSCFSTNKIVCDIVFYVKTRFLVCYKYDFLAQHNFTMKMSISLVFCAIATDGIS